MTLLSDVLRVEDSIATIWRKLNVPMAFPLAAGLGLASACSSAVLLVGPGALLVL